MNTKTRVLSMLRLDFYRLFHTPAFAVMLAVSAIIPAMLLTMSGAGTAGPDGAVQQGIEMTNVWQVVETLPGGVSGSVADFGSFANVNMVFIFEGLLMAIFISHDYSSGFVKNVFTVHAKKTDYVASKTAAGVFSGAGLMIAYLTGAVAAGLITGKSFDADIGGLIFCILSKMFLMGVFTSLFLSVAVFFRQNLWLTIVFTFLFGMMLYPAASVATLGSTAYTALLSLAAGVAGSAAIGAVSAFILSRRDLA